MYKVLVLVPHPDDEINVAGNLFKWFKEAKAHVTVAIVTNGDYISALTKKILDIAAS
jgi:LmbE family N-acetylglucosaminyl deacetylase